MIDQRPLLVQPWLIGISKSDIMALPSLQRSPNAWTSSPSTAIRTDRHRFLEDVAEAMVRTPARMDGEANHNFT